MELNLLLIFYVLLGFVSSNHDADKESYTDCESTQYLDVKINMCIECTKCGSNQIIRKPCEAFSDALCGPFFEFDRFHQAPILNLLPNGTSHIEEVYTEQNEIHVEHVDGTGTSTLDSGAPISVNKDEKWYTLAMALMGILCFVCLFVVLYIVFVCFVCKRRRREKQIVYDPEFTTPLAASKKPHYVETQVLPSSRDRLKNNKTLYAEESDDSGGTTSNGIIISFPDASEYDADNSGQTVSSTSTNYVYFKAPSTRPEVANV